MSLRNVSVSKPRAPSLASYSGQSTARKLAICPETGLLACGSDSLGILHVTPTSVRLLCSFAVNTRVTAVAWSTSSVHEDRAFVQLIVACADIKLRMIAAEIPLDGGPAENERMTIIGSGGHRSKITSIATARGHDAVFATASEDGKVLLWRWQEPGQDDSMVDDQAPTITAIPHKHPVVAVSFHPRHFGLLATLDDHGNAHLVDLNTLRPRISFTDPAGGAPGACRGSLDWTGPMLGAANRRAIIWDTALGNGGTPWHAVDLFAKGADVLRFGPNELVAIASSAPPTSRSQPALLLARIGSLDSA